MMKSPDEILSTYREALRAIYGNEVADKSDLSYNRGWFYVEIARRFPDNSCGIISSILGPQPMRRGEIEQRTKVLLGRVGR